jgi:uncharacterized protein with PQ loop repeat
MLTSTIFSFFLALASSPSRKGPKAVAIIVYLAFFFITMVPTILLAFDDYDEDNGWTSMVFGLVLGFLTDLVAPFVQLAGLLAFLPQARSIYKHHGTGSISVRGLFVQAVVFLLVGISFIFRLKLPAKSWRNDHPVSQWYEVVGWATINNLIFALAQGLLGWIAVVQKRKVTELAMPLLV